MHMNILFLLTEIYGEIMTVAERSETPLSSSAIHGHIGGPDVCSVWDVRRCLFNLQDNQIMKKTDDDSWILYEKCDGKCLVHILDSQHCGLSFFGSFVMMPRSNRVVPDILVFTHH